MRGVGCFSWRYYYYDTVFCVSVPLRGVGCFSDKSIKPLVLSVSVPLRGVGCFPQSISQALQQLFPSPCGVWVVSNDRCNKTVNKIVSVPLRGGGGVMTVYIAGFRPLAGCGLFLKTYMVAIQGQVSVPLRGVGCFQSITNMIIALTSFRPLAGCGLFPGVDGEWQLLAQKFPSPCGVWVVSSGTPTRHSSPIFPSPCGVWVVSI